LTNPDAWLAELDPDSSVELRVAVALASGRDAGDPTSQCALRTLLTPTVTGQGLRWTDRPAPVSMAGDPVRAIAQVHRLRALPGAVADPAQSELASPHQPPPAVRGTFTAFGRSATAGPQDLAAFATGFGFNDEVFGSYLRGLVLFDWRNARSVLPSPDGPVLMPPGLSLLLPFFASAPLALPTEELDMRLVTLRPAASWLSQLLAGSVAPVMDDAVRRLRAAGLTEIIRPDGRTALDSTRLAAALLVPTGRFTRVAALDRVAVLPRPKKTTDTPDLLEGAPA
jgi:CRISPR-associated protein Csx17